jgi:hypothetical protein
VGTTFLGTIDEYQLIAAPKATPIINTAAAKATSNVFVPFFMRMPLPPIAKSYGAVTTKLSK